jgi:predicted peptidase
MLVTQCPQDNPYWNTSVSSEGKGDAPITIAIEIFEALLEEYPIDQNRISTFGQCSGAVGSWDLIQRFPSKIAAVVSISATPPNGPPVTDVAFSAFNCTGDPMTPIQPMRDFVKKVNDAGGSACLTEIKSFSHNAWTPALLRCNVIAWMVTQEKDSKLCPPPGVVCEGRTWGQAFWYFGVPVCCMIPFLIVRMRTRK